MYEAAFGENMATRQKLKRNMVTEMDRIRDDYRKCGPDFNLWTANIKASQVLRCLGDCTLESLKTTEPLVQLQALLQAKSGEGLVLKYCTTDSVHYENEDSRNSVFMPKPMMNQYRKN